MIEVSVSKKHADSIKFFWRSHIYKPFYIKKQAGSGVTPAPFEFLSDYALNVKRLYAVRLVYSL